MKISVRLLALGMIVAFAPIANAGGLGAVADEPSVIVADDNVRAAVIPMGSLGSGGAAVAGLALLLVAAALASSGSH